MKYCIMQDGIAINVTAPQDVGQEILKFLKYFVNIIEPVNEPDYAIVFNEKGEIAPQDAIELKESNASLYSKIKINQNEANIWFNPNEDPKKDNMLAIMLATNVYARILENNGYLFLHCSCVSKNGQALIVCGNKNTGKTVNLLNLMGNGFDFVTNDLLAIKEIDGKLICHGMPFYVGVRMTTPWIDQEANKKYLDFAFSRNFKINPENADNDENKLYISPIRVAKLNNVSVCKSVVLYGILNTVYCDGIKNVKLVKLPNEKVKELIISQKMRALHSSKKFLAEIKSKDIVASEISKANVIEQLSNLLTYASRQNEFTANDMVVVANGILRKINKQNEETKNAL